MVVLPGLREHVAVQIAVHRGYGGGDHHRVLAREHLLTLAVSYNLRRYLLFRFPCELIRAARCALVDIDGQGVACDRRPRRSKDRALGTHVASLVRSAEAPVA